MGYGMDGFLFPVAVRDTALLQTVFGIHPTCNTGIKRPGSETDLSLPSRAEVINVELYLHSPIRLRGIVLN
jgi:hypothetical protein